MSDAQDVRLIERWLPIAELGIESIRERKTSMKGNVLPPLNFLHVWWARRPLVASRAAVLASLLPAGADRKAFMHTIGIVGNPLAAIARKAEALKNGIHLGEAAFDYPRAFKHSLSDSDLAFIKRELGANFKDLQVLDPTAGGGAIPFEAIRLGLNAAANDLNPVAALLLKLTIQAPRELGWAALDEYRRITKNFLERATPRFVHLFPREPEGAQVLGYLWARTIHCPYCDGLVPMSPNWRLNSDGIGVRLLPKLSQGPGTPGRVCGFEIVRSANLESGGTVAGGDARCPFPDCGRVIDGDEVKRQAQAGELGDQLYAVAYKRRVQKPTKTGKIRGVLERGYRAPAAPDDVLGEIKRCLAEKISVWEALDVAPSEAYPTGTNDRRPIEYGMPLWRDLFNARQVYGHCTAVEVYRELLEEERATGGLAPTTAAAFGYLALALDKMLNYNSRMSVWMPTREVIANSFNRHDFAFCSSYAEMPPLVTGLGCQWAFEQTAKCIEELIELAGGCSSALLGSTIAVNGARATIACEDAVRLAGIFDSSVDAVVIDPPYYDNVMYAELSDFFYVWLKRTAGLIYPELFRTRLTDKEHEAVANPARYDGQPGAKVLAAEDYRRKMAAIFAECRRVLKPTGIMTLMFTHKATGAWDALAQGLIDAGFVITASWPINTESEVSLNIRDKAAANSTIFLACRPRLANDEENVYWDDLERQVRTAVRTRIGEFQEAGIRGVDLYLASFGPALEVFSRHWPVQRMTPREVQVSARRSRPRRGDKFEEAPFDPYAVTPEDALDAAREEVKHWRLEQLSKLAARDGLDPVTSWFVLAWDAFESAVFPYDEALRLARVCGVSLDDEIVKRCATKKGDSLTLMDSAARAAKHVLGPPDGTRTLLDAVHHAAYLARTRSLAAARALLEEHQLVHRPAFIAAFDAIRQVLPVSQEYSGEALPAVAVGAGDDFRALEDLRKLLYATELPPPHQLELTLRP